MTETIGSVISIIEQFAPLGYQENYDNAGLQIGDYKTPVSNVLVCIDITEEVIDEAISKKAELIVSHHPLIFVGIKRLVGNTYVERCIAKAIRNNIAIYFISIYSSSSSTGRAYSSFSIVRSASS